MRIALPGSHSQGLITAKTQRGGGDDGTNFPDERRPAISLINLFMAARNALIERQRCRHTYNALMALDDRSLADIGMQRAQIPAIVEAMYDRTKLRPVAPPRLGHPLGSSVRSDGRLGASRKY